MSLAVPVTVTGPAGTEAPFAGDVIVTVGGVVSVDLSAATRPACSVLGCAPMSASRLTVACCMAGSGLLLVWVLVRSWWLSSPHAHCTVPAPNTSPPLDDRYRLRWCWSTPAKVETALVEDSNTRPAGYQAMYCSYCGLHS